jgi:hypothetical protein
MNLLDCFKYVGLPSTHTEVKNLLQDLGCKKEPKCKKDDPNFYFTNNEHLVELIFEDEDHLKNDDSKDVYGKSPLILIAINLPMLSEFASYPNSFIELPSGIDFGTDRAKVLETMGESSKSFESGGKIRNDQWVHNLGRIVITYNSASVIKNIQIVSSKYD